jgi:AraC-like DNA-binding protein
VDSLASLFTRPTGGTSAFVLRIDMQAPFGIELADGAPLSIVTARRAALHIDHPDGRFELAPGDLALVRGERRWRLAADPAAGVSAVIHPGQRCETICGEPVGERWSLGVRRWGNLGHGAEPTHTVITGTYEQIPETGRWLLDALPGVLVLPEHTIDPTLLAWFEAEIARDDLAQTAVLERMLDLLVVLAVRHWLSATPDLPAGVLRGVSDPSIGRAIRLIQHDPTHPWTVHELARSVGLSRAGFARRFHAVVGTPPISFLTNWRLAVAADLLTETRIPIAQIATEVGYTNSFAFSTAFKRRYGTSPQQRRRIA